MPLSEPEILDLERRAVAHEFRVTTRNRDVVEEDVCFGMPAHGRDVGVEQEPRTDVGTPSHDEKSGARWKRGDRLKFFGGFVTVERGQLGTELVAVVNCRVFRIDHREPFLRGNRIGFGGRGDAGNSHEPHRFDEIDDPRPPVKERTPQRESPPERVGEPRGIRERLTEHE